MNGDEKGGEKRLFQGIWPVLKESGRAAGAQSARRARTREAAPKFVP